jgi:hypothetical protein
MLFSYINCFSSCQSGIVNNKYSILIVNRVKVSIDTVYDILSIYGEGVMDLRFTNYDLKAQDAEKQISSLLFWSFRLPA